MGNCAYYIIALNIYHMSCIGYTKYTKNQINYVHIHTYIMRELDISVCIMSLIYH